MSVTALAALLALAAAEPAAATETPAQPAGFCDTLTAIVAAEDEPSPFASLVRPAPFGNMEWSKLTVPGYDYCVLMWIERGRALSCSRNLSPPELTAANLAQATADCLGPTAIASEPVRGSRDRSFDYRAVRILIEEECDSRCHVGRRVTFTVEARRKP